MSHLSNETQSPYLSVVEYDADEYRELRKRNLKYQSLGMLCVVLLLVSGANAGLRRDELMMLVTAFAVIPMVVLAIKAGSIRNRYLGLKKKRDFISGMRGFFDSWMRSSERRTDPVNAVYKLSVSLDDEKANVYQVTVFKRDDPMRAAKLELGSTFIGSPAHYEAQKMTVRIHALFSGVVQTGKEAEELDELLERIPMVIPTVVASAIELRADD